MESDLNRTVVYFIIANIHSLHTSQLHLTAMIGYYVLENMTIMTNELTYILMDRLNSLHNQIFRGYH